MPFGNLSGPTLLVILFIVLLLFGAPKLPALARSLGQSMKILKKEVTSDKAAEGPDVDAAAKNTNEAAAAGPSTSASAPVSPEEELAQAKAEAEAAKAEAEALRAAQQKRDGNAS